MQLTETLRIPSSNQRMRKSSLLKLTSLIRVGKAVHSSRSATPRQNPSGSVSAALHAFS